VARKASTYRAARRNRCHRRQGLTADRGRWPEDGVQLDPVFFQPTDHYKQPGFKAALRRQLSIEKR